MNVIHSSRLIAAGLTALMISTGGAAAQQAAEEKVVATHGAWQVRCSGDEDVCILSQVGKDSNGKDVLEVQVRKLNGAKAPDGTPIPGAVQIVTPLGVLLPAGVRIQVDGNKERAAPYEVCTQTGCLVRQPISTDLINELKAGAHAKVTIVAAPQQEIPVTLSLSGFTKGFGALK